MADPSVSSCARLDDSFGPHAGACRGGFDFTLLFEETILTILPVCLILAVSPFRIWFLSRRAKKVTGGFHLAGVKIVSDLPKKDEAGKKKGVCV